jgi:hypothetical protein
VILLRRVGIASVAAVAAVAIGAAASGRARIVLPNGWLLAQPAGTMTLTDTMPQGGAASPDEKTLAVVNAGFNKPTLRLYAIPSLEQLASIPLPGAFGRPLWLDGEHVLVAGANADAVLDVDIVRQGVRSIAMPAHSYPVAIAKAGDTVAVATDGDTSVRIGSLDDLASAPPVRVGGHIGGLAFSPDGTLYASNSSSDFVLAINPHAPGGRRIPTGLHPTAILPRNGEIYVAQSDADSVGVYSPSGRRIASVYLGLLPAGMGLDGVSPNALVRQGDSVLVSLGAANAIAIIRNRTVVDRIPAGWYPTDAVPIGKRLYIIDGKGEGSTANPYFRPRRNRDYDYIASLQYGSIRTYDLGAIAHPVTPAGAIGWRVNRTDPVVRAGGPIKHVFFILKENRTYDQILGDMPQGNGDPKLAWFGAEVTPNQHALAAQYGLFDDFFASGEVSEAGHYWADMAFVNDYTERTWPSVYGNRDTVDDALSAIGTAIPRNGYIWQAAKAAHIHFRNYGEMSAVAAPFGPASNPDKALEAMSDSRYASFDLDYSDLNRAQEWRREFREFLRQGDVPQIEYIWLPNDHTYGSRAGKPTPVAYVAQNDYALGRIVDTISHSAIWSSSVIFITEDDAQDGADHVSDQRTTFFLVSPYSRGGLEHSHYSTVSILRTMELILGLKPLSEYDAMAVPLYAAFTSTPHMRPFDVIAPKVRLASRNAANAYGAKLSSELDFTRPDAIGGHTLLQILAHNHAIGSTGFQR